MTVLEERLGYEFRDPALLARALTHRSHSVDHNERLEFVGDSVLNCVMALALYKLFPQLPEGDLSRIRANLVNRDSLLQRAQDLQLAGLVRLGEGEVRSGGESRPSILSDAAEAVFGAVFLDGGFESARTVIERCYADAIGAVNPAVSGKDPKTRLQEWLQGKGFALPAYVVTSVQGEAHKQSFTVACRIEALQREAIGKGTSRRAAEQDAARAVLEELS